MSVEQQDIELQAKMLAELQKEAVDVSLVLALATELAKNDADNVRFFTDAGILRRLGYELVSRQETAVSELVKNAYDADATNVRLIFTDSDVPGGSLEIVDNGNGMTRGELVDGFMRLSSDLKIREPVSPRYQRQRAGRKGIGRFAVQRLGSRLTITTQTIDDDHALRVRIDWDKFIPGQDLTTIASRIEKVEKSQDEGTSLLIESLRDSWRESQIRRVWRYVSDLIQPLAVSHELSLSGADPGCRAEFYRVQDEGPEVVADEQTEIFQHAVAVIDASVDSRGYGRWGIRSHRFSEISDDEMPIGLDSDDPSIPFENLRDVRLKAYYFIYQAALLPPMMDNTIRRIADEWGGIRLFRNGFRVLPYGERRDDWLNLDKTYARRQILVPISNLNFFGYVAVTDPEGQRFEETASREGLIENDAFRELTSFAFRVLRAAVLRVGEARQTKRIAAGRESQIEDPPEEKIQQALRELRTITESQGEVEYHAEAAIQELEVGISELTQQFTLRQADLIDELGMLRVLASLGIMVGEFTHEIGHTLNAAKLNSQDLVREVREPTSAKNLALNLAANIERIRSYARYFDGTVRANVRRELVPHELGRVLVDFQRELSPSAERRNVKLEISVNGFDLYTVPMHNSELASILFNLYSNALKAVTRAKPELGQILIRAGLQDRIVYIEFCDNGDGVPEDILDRIFNPFFTTTTYGGDDSDEDLLGTGLGLKIVSDIVEGYGGAIYLSDLPNDLVTCFRVELPAASEEILGRYSI